MDDLYSKFENLLPQTYKKIEEYFPNYEYSTTIEEGPEDNCKSLVVHIHALPDKVDEALDLLNKFDEEWWCAHPDRCQPSICVTLKFEEIK